MLAPVPRPSRVAPPLLAAAALVAILAAVAVALSGGGARTGAGGFDGALRPAMPPRDFTLTDQDGRRVSTRALRGRVVVVTFLYSTCTDTCPIVAQQIAGAMDRLGHDVPALAVSVDPAHDTPAL